jgi:large subunit ribosomal protein L17
MRHLWKGRKLGRTTAHRQAMSSNLVTSLFVYGRVVTTVEKAMELRGLAEKMITFAKRGGLANFRRILRTVRDKHVVKKIVEDVAKRFTDRQGGYTRVIKLGGSRWDGDGRGAFAFNRLGDNGRKAIFELVVRKEREEEMKLAGRGKLAHEAAEAKRLDKKKGSAAKGEAAKK